MSWVCFEGRAGLPGFTALSCPDTLHNHPWTPRLDHRVFLYICQSRSSFFFLTISLGLVSTVTFSVRTSLFSLINLQCFTHHDFFVFLPRICHSQALFISLTYLVFCLSLTPSSPTRMMLHKMIYSCLVCYCVSST